MMSEAEVIKNPEKQPVTVDSLKADLIKLGVAPGMALIVHSSLSSLGWVSGGPVGVILALEEVLGPEGTLVMATHSGDLSDPAEWMNPPVPREWVETIRRTMPAYDSDLTPTRGVGRIPETFRKQRGAARSAHPHVSFAAWGKDAGFITEGHLLDFGLGEGSPLARLYELDAWILLLGVDHGSNTSLHLAEYRADYPGKKEIKQGAPLLISGQRQWVVFNELEEFSEDFNQVGQAYLDGGGRCREGLIGRARSQLLPQRELVDFAVKWMAGNRHLGSGAAKSQTE